MSEDELAIWAADRPPPAFGDGNYAAKNMRRDVLPGDSSFHVAPHKIRILEVYCSMRTAVSTPSGRTPVRTRTAPARTPPVQPNDRTDRDRWLDAGVASNGNRALTALRWLRHWQVHREATKNDPSLVVRT